MSRSSPPPRRADEERGEGVIDATTAGPSRIRRTSRNERRLVVVLAVAGGILAVLGGASPTGIGLVDVAYTGAAGAALVAASARARRLSWLIMAVAAVWVAPDTPGRLVAVAAVLLAIYAAATRRRRALGAGIGVLVAAVLGDLGAGPFHGSTTLVAAAVVVPVAVSAGLLVPPGTLRLIRVAGGAALAFAVAATMLFGASVVLALDDVETAVDAATRGFAAVSAGDEVTATSELDSAASSFRAARGKVGGFWTLPARLVPVVGQHARAAQVVASEGVGLSVTAADAARSVDPDQIRMVAGRVDLDQVEALAPLLDRTERALERAHRRISAANSAWLHDAVDSRIDELLDEIDHARPAAHTAALAAREVPAMLGAERPVFWLVALTTPAEARGLGGLIGNWVLIGADDGAVGIIQSGRNSDLNALLERVGAELHGPDQYVDRWGRFTPERFFQDVTLSPDLPMVGAVASDLFEQATGRPVDGVMILDPYAIAAVLRLSGPVRTDDLTLGADSVVPFILQDQYTLFDSDEARVEILGQLMEGAFFAFTNADLPGPTGITDALGPLVEQGRLGAWWAGEDGPAELLAATGLDNRFPDPAGGDLLGVVHQNAGQNKLDVYLDRFIDYRLDIDDGRAEGTIAVTLSNTVPTLDLPDAVVGSNDQGYPRGTNVARVTVHTALGLRAARLDGAPVDVERELAFGLDAITALIEIPPGEFRTLELDVAGPLDLDASDYRLTIPVQPLVTTDRMQVRITIDGDEILVTDDLVLVTDTVVGPGADAAATD